MYKTGVLPFYLESVLTASLSIRVTFRNLLRRWESVNSSGSGLEIREYGLGDLLH
jgi:hypothetical protein